MTQQETTKALEHQSLGEVYMEDNTLFKGHYCPQGAAVNAEVFMFTPHDHWYLGFNFPDGYVAISFCPFCGQMLNTVHPKN